MITDRVEIEKEYMSKRRKLKIKAAVKIVLTLIVTLVIIVIQSIVCAAISKSVGGVDSKTVFRIINGISAFVIGIILSKVISRIHKRLQTSLVSLCAIYITKDAVAMDKYKEDIAKEFNIKWMDNKEHEIINSEEQLNKEEDEER